MAIKAKRRPQDATMRNVRAAKQRATRLEHAADHLTSRVRRLESQVNNLSKAVAMLAREQARLRTTTSTRR